MRYKSVILIFTALFLTLSLLLPACNRKTTTTDPFEHPVLNSDIIVLGIISGEKSETVTVTSGGLAGTQYYTIFTLSVEKVIKGDPATKEVLFKKEYMGDLPPYFQVSDRVLLCLNKEGDNLFKYRQDGPLWIKGKSVASVASLEEIICRVTTIMKKNKVQIALTSDEIAAIKCPPQTITERIYDVISPHMWIMVLLFIAIIGIITAVAIKRYTHAKQPNLRVGETHHLKNYI